MHDLECDAKIGGEDLGLQPCDGLICSTPSGSTAYNLSNGGPVLVWGIDAMAVTFIAPHSLHARPLVVPRGRDLVITNSTAQGAVSLLVDACWRRSRRARSSAATGGRSSPSNGSAHNRHDPVTPACASPRYRP